MNSDSKYLESIHDEIEAADPIELRNYLAGASRDGTINKLHGTLRFAQADVRWLEILGRALRRLGASSWTYREGNRNVWVLETCWRSLQIDLDLEGISAARGFIRGYFDAEGGVPRDPQARFYIQLVQKDRRDLAGVRCALQRLGIRCGRLHNPSWRVDPHYWRFFVSAAAHGGFIANIGSWHPRKRELLLKRLDPDL